MNMVFFSSHFVGIQNFANFSQKVVEIFTLGKQFFIYIKKNSNTLVEDLGYLRFRIKSNTQN
jgi:hypothetical protein